MYWPAVPWTHVIKECTSGYWWCPGKEFRASRCLVESRQAQNLDLVVSPFSNTGSWKQRLHASEVVLIPNIEALATRRTVVGNFGGGPTRAGGTLGVLGMHIGCSAAKEAGGPHE